MYNSSKQLHFFFSVGSDASTHPSSLSFSKKRERLVFYYHRHRTLNVQKNILPLQIVLITFSCVSRIRRPPFLINKAFFLFLSHTAWPFTTFSWWRKSSGFRVQNWWLRGLLLGTDRGPKRQSDLLDARANMFATFGKIKEAASNSFISFQTLRLGVQPRRVKSGLNEWVWRAIGWWCWDTSVHGRNACERLPCDAAERYPPLQLFANPAIPHSLRWVGSCRPSKSWLQGKSGKTRVSVLIGSGLKLLTGFFATSPSFFISERFSMISCFGQCSDRSVLTFNQIIRKGGHGRAPFVFFFCAFQEHPRMFQGRLQGTVFFFIYA